MEIWGVESSDFLIWFWFGLEILRLVYLIWPFILQKNWHHTWCQPKIPPKNALKISLCKNISSFVKKKSSASFWNQRKIVLVLLIIFFTDNFCAASLFPKQNYNVPSPNSYTYISVRDLYRYFLDPSVYFAAAENVDRTWDYTYKSLSDTRM